MDITNLTTTEAAKMGVQAFRDGKTFAAYNVRPAGFSLACILGKRTDLLTALDNGWHMANLAEPVTLSDGRVMGYSPAAEALETICNA